MLHFLIDATPNTLVNKLESMEKVVKTMQEDMTWMRKDLGVVHEVMQNIVEHVSLQVKIMTKIDKLGEQRSIEVCAWGTWKDKLHTDVCDGAKTTRIADDDRVHLHNKKPSHIHGGHEAINNIQKT